MGKAARLFNGTAEQTLIGRLTPSEDQRNFLQERWNNMANHLKVELNKKHEYPISTWLQGSYKFGTLIKPVHKGEEYDVDVGLYFEWNDDEEKIRPSPGQLRTWVQKELNLYKNQTPEVNKIFEPPKERCSRICYDGQFHIDIPVYRHNRPANRRQLANLSDEWEDSDPKTIYLWFKSFVELPDRDQLRRLIRYLKGWAAVAFKDFNESRPSSIVLTVLATEAYSEEDLANKSIDDDDALIAVIRSIHSRLSISLDVLNPINKSENLNRIPEKKQQKFFEILDLLKNITDKADECDEELSAALTWSEVFLFLMPLPEIDEVEVIDVNSGKALMVLPDIQIDVFARNPKKLIATHVNAVPKVSKKCDLTFSIKNPAVIPQYATIEWMVRNAGQEAELIGDLGHMGTTKGLKAEESTAYFGKHYMDCIVRASGNVVAVRRVLVHVSDTERPQRNSIKPTYTRIKSFLRRR